MNEHDTQRWSHLIMLIVKGTPLSNIDGMNEILLNFCERDFIKRNTLYPEIPSPFIDFKIAFMQKSNLSVSEYLNEIAQQTLEALKIEVNRIIKEGCRTYNIKIIDKVYNPFLNKIGYTLDDGDVVFTDEIVEKTTYNITSKSLMRKVNISSILNEKAED
jgi:hypothetical protein